MKPANPSKVIIVPRPPVNNDGQNPSGAPAAAQTGQPKSEQPKTGNAQAEEVQAEEVQAQPCQATPVSGMKTD